MLYKHISNPSIIHSVDDFCDGLFRSASFTALMPFMLSMFGNILTISNETRIASLGNPFGFMLSIIYSKCSVWLILASMLLIKGAQFFSMNLDKFSIVVLQPVVDSLIGFPSLCVLYNVELFAG